MASTRARVRLAVFGVGRIGHAHLLNLIRSRDRVELLYIVDLGEDVCQKVIDKYQLDTTTPLSISAAERVYEDDRVDAVVVCTPTEAHEGIVKDALKHGKGVFCEKPLAKNLDAIEQCYAEAEKSGKPLLCGFNRRFDPTLAAVRSRITNGEIGQIHVVKTTSRGHPEPSMDYLKTSGGFYHDAVIHDIDMVCWLVQDYPITVFARGHAHSPAIAALGDIDTAVVVMTFSSGVIATIDASRYASYGYDQRVEVFGSDGQLRTDNQHVTSIHGYNLGGVQTDKLKFSLLERYRDSYAMEMDHFLDVMQGDSSPSVTSEQTINVFKLSSACQRSRDSGQPITMDYRQ